MKKYTKTVEETFDEEGRLISRITTEITEYPTYTNPYVHSSGIVYGSEGSTTWNYKPGTGPFTT